MSEERFVSSRPPTEKQRWLLNLLSRLPLSTTDALTARRFAEPYETIDSLGSALRRMEKRDWVWRNPRGQWHTTNQGDAARGR